ncbi:MAG: RNA repair transcriptional activator RtcR family protein, partial [Acidobacteriota bacterium]
MAKKTVIIGILGLRLDSGRGPDRWSRWRPSVDLCQHQDFLVDRFELLAQPEHMREARRVVDDITAVS